jgi:hypothetical protein
MVGCAASTSVPECGRPRPEKRTEGNQAQIGLSSLKHRVFAPGDGRARATVVIATRFLL